MEFFIALVAIVFGILNLILFFKLWGMTNDVRAFKSKYIDTKPTTEDPAVRYNSIKVVKGAEAAREYLLDYLVEWVSSEIGNDFENLEQTKRVLSLRYYPLLQEAGLQDFDFSCVEKYIESKRNYVPGGFEIGSKVKFKDFAGQEFNGTVEAYDTLELRCKIRTNDNYLYSVRLEKCEPITE